MILETKALCLVEHEHGYYKDFTVILQEMLAQTYTDVPR